MKDKSTKDRVSLQMYGRVKQTLEDNIDGSKSIKLLHHS